MNILETICARKRLEVARQKDAVSLSHLRNLLHVWAHEKISFRQSLADSPPGIVAEFKRRSPSKGWIHPNACVETIVKEYEDAGAAAISVLTDESFFGGSFSDFKKARKAVTKIPILRKDFIVDAYQIYQSKVLGADVVLLIAACLTKEESLQFSAIAHELDMEVLLEIHNRDELDYIQPLVDVVGINNRNLKTFDTDVQCSLDLAHPIPDEYFKISESGLSDPATIKHLLVEGFNGFLMGEIFMKKDHPGQALQEFITHFD
ncbi:MAG: indole-3-glycerol phosphate synthase TrpC [Candidatus Azobacteroides sp.]|nr:indole-3-glycerol phosphate synthase TrpC [Candidatus Azobacteroides sp.]